MSNKRAYLKVIAIPLKFFLIYRTDFLLNVSMYVIPLYAKYFLFKIVYQSGASLGNYNLKQILTYYLISTIFYENMPFYANYDTIHHIRDGRLSLFLTKPMSYEIYSFAMTVGNRINTISTTLLALLLYLPITLKYLYIPPITNLLMFIVFSFMGFLLAYYLGTLFNYSSFYFGDAERGYSFYNILISLFGGQLLPIDILPGGKILSYNPFAMSIYVPTYLFTHRVESSYLITHFVVAALWLIFLRWILKITYIHGLKRYEASGG